MTVAALAATLGLVLAQAPYYRLSTTNSANVTHCLWWPDDRIELRAEATGTPEIPGEEEFTAISRALATWQAEFNACSGITVTEGPRTSQRYVGFNPKDPGANENAILFRQKGQCRDVVPADDPCWDASVFYCANVHDCWAHARGAIAITTNSFDGKNGLIFDADVEFNDAAFRFTATEATGPHCVPPSYEGCVYYDLENTMTHELGHVFGLDHDVSDSSSTMYDLASDGDTFMRSLDPGSIQFVCDTYPPDSPSRDCVVQRLDPSLGRSGSCAVTGGAPLLGAALALLALLGRRRRA